MKIGVLAAGITPDELLEQHGSYADMVVNLLKTTEQDFQFEIFDVRLDDFPSDLNEFDGWAITGSKNNVSENLPWMSKLKQLILNAKDNGQPMVGICFGHQIIADALGGKVDRYNGGWGIGLHQYAITGDWEFVPTDMNSFAINAVHQDQVVEKPASSKVFASSDFCKNAGLVYDGFAITLQAHPEFSIDYEQDLITVRKGNTFPEQLSDEAIEDLKLESSKTDSLEVAKWLGQFLLNNKK
jgi:GMP synthase-like glutamine amidotransferase